MYLQNYKEREGERKGETTHDGEGRYATIDGGPRRSDNASWMLR